MFVGVCVVQLLLQLQQEVSVKVIQCLTQNILTKYYPLFSDIHCSNTLPGYVDAKRWRHAVHDDPGRDGHQRQECERALAPDPVHEPPRGDWTEGAANVEDGNHPGYLFFRQVDFGVGRPQIRHGGGWPAQKHAHHEKS